MGFVQRMFLAAFLASVACGLIGTYVVVRRIVFISGGIAHSTFGGIGAAYLIQAAGWTWFDPLLGALLFALGAAVILSSKWMREKIREDSTIGILWVVGMALGILFINLVDQSKVQVQDPMSILFGNILLIGRSDLILMGALVCIIVVLTTVLFKDLKILTFDEEFAKVSGMNVQVMNLLLLTMIAFTTVILIKVVGVILIIAMLTIPPAVSGIFMHRLRPMMVTAVGVGVALTFLGSLMSLQFDLPPGATIVTVMGASFVAVMAGKGVASRISGNWASE